MDIINSLINNVTNQIIDEDIRQDIILHIIENKNDLENIDIKELEKKYKRRYIDYRQILFSDLSNNIEIKQSFIDNIILKSNEILPIVESKIKGRRLSIKNVMTYEEAKIWCKENNIKSAKQLRKKKKPINFPTNPNAYYKNKGWSTWMNFFDSNQYYTQRECWDYETMHRWIYDNLLPYKIKTVKKFNSWKSGKIVGAPSIPIEFIRTPDRILKGKGWKSWMEFLFSDSEPFNFNKYKPNKLKTSIKKEKNEFLSFKDAKKWVLENIPVAFHSKRGWYEFLNTHKKPAFIPYKPMDIYKTDWKGFIDWFSNKKLPSCTRISNKEREVYINKNNKKILVKIVGYDNKHGFIGINLFETISEYPVGSKIRFWRKDIIQGVRGINPKIKIQNHPNFIGREIPINKNGYKFYVRITDFDFQSTFKGVVITFDIKGFEWLSEIEFCDTDILKRKETITLINSIDWFKNNISCEQEKDQKPISR